MTETATTETTTADEVRNRPFLMNDTPVDDGCDTIEMYIREGDTLTTVRHTQVDSVEDADGNEVEVQREITTYLRTDELFELAMSAGKAMAELRDRANLVGLIQGLVDVLGEM